MRKHFLEYGINEGRQGSIVFDVNYYKNSYHDLRANLGKDNHNYVNHFIQYGLNEERRASKEVCPGLHQQRGLPALARVERRVGMIVEYCDKCGADIRKNDGINKAIYVSVSGCYNAGREVRLMLC